MEPVRHIYLADEKATQDYGETLARWVRRDQQTSFYFQGDIGAGETTLIRSLLRSLGVQGPIKSPTFSIVETYDNACFPIYHFDLYRLSDPQELAYLGWRECFSGPSLCCVEWPERVQSYLPEPTFWLRLSPLGEGRNLEIVNGCFF